MFLWVINYPVSQNPTAAWYTAGQPSAASPQPGSVQGPPSLSSPAACLKTPIAASCLPHEMDMLLICSVIKLRIRKGSHSASGAQRTQAQRGDEEEASDGAGGAPYLRALIPCLGPGEAPLGSGDLSAEGRASSPGLLPFVSCRTSLRKQSVVIQQHIGVLPEGFKECSPS